MSCVGSFGVDSWSKPESDGDTAADRLQNWWYKSWIFFGFDLLKYVKIHKKTKKIKGNWPIPTSAQFIRAVLRQAHCQVSQESGKRRILWKTASPSTGKPRVQDVLEEKKNSSNFRYTQLHGSVSMFTCSLDLGDALTVAEAWQCGAENPYSVLDLY